MKMFAIYAAVVFTLVATAAAVVSVASKPIPTGDVMVTILSADREVVAKFTDEAALKKVEKSYELADFSSIDVSVTLTDDGEIEAFRATGTLRK